MLCECRKLKIWRYPQNEALLGKKWEESEVIEGSLQLVEEHLPKN
jgi:hypothetical protein